jgi:hypothetical protein
MANNLFANFNAFKENLNSETKQELFPSPKRKSPQKKQQNSWNSYQYANENQNYALVYQNEFNQNGGLILRNLPSQELAHVFQFVRYVYLEIYPMKSGETPVNWITTILSIYKDIRYEKAKQELGINKPRYQLTKNENMQVFEKTKTTLKGLQSHEIVGSIIYCYLIANNIPIPQSVLVIIMNNALKRFREKKTNFTLEKFEKYRRMNTTRLIISKLKPECYRTKNIPAERYIRLMSNMFLKIEPKLILCAENVCRRMQQLRKNGFKQTVTQDLKAIASVAAVCKYNGIHFSARTFGLQGKQFNDAVDVVLSNSDENVQEYLKCK